MGVSKVTYNGRTLVDLTADTVAADSMLEGVTAHAANGEKVTGVLKQVEFDGAPTAGSSNAVTSGGVKSYVDARGGTSVGTSAPADTSMLWVDTGNGAVLKYYDATGKAWKAVGTAWS